MGKCGGGKAKRFVECGKGKFHSGAGAAGASAGSEGGQAGGRNGGRLGGALGTGGGKKVSQSSKHTSPSHSSAALQIHSQCGLMLEQ